MPTHRRRSLIAVLTATLAVAGCASPPNALEDAGPDAAASLDAATSDAADPTDVVPGRDARTQRDTAMGTDVPITPPMDSSMSGGWPEMLNAINTARATARSCGGTAMPAVGALTWNAQLAAAAQGHSDHMAMTSCFSHDMTGTTPCADGTMCDRIVAAGYRYGGIGENIAAGQRDVAAVMAGWLASAGHCRNIMNGTYTEVGAALARGGRYGYYWTQNFGRPGGASTCR